MGVWQLFIPQQLVLKIAIRLKAKPAAPKAMSFTRKDSMIIPKPMSKRKTLKKFQFVVNICFIDFV